MEAKVLNHSLSNVGHSVLISLIILNSICTTDGRILDLEAFAKTFPLALSRRTTFIAELARSFNWTSVGILHDTASEAMVSSLYEDMTQKTPSTQILDFNIDIKNVREILRTTHRIMFPFINIVLMCDSLNSQSVLEMANDYDSVSNRTSDFRHLSKWIVLIDRSSRILQDIKHLALDLENVLFITIPLHLDRDTECVNVFTLHGTGTAGTLARVTSFDLKDVFPNMKYGYNNRQLLVSTMKRIIEPPDNEWGYNKNGTWTGMVKQLQEREVDMVAVALTMSDDRAAVLDYLLPPFITTYIDVLYRKGDVEDYSWFMLLEPFQPRVLLMLAVCITVVLLLYGVLELHQRHSGGTRKTKETPLWFIVGSILKQASTHTYSNASGKILTSFWWIFLIVISSIYTAKLVALLSAKKSKPPPFTNLLELSQRQDYTIGFPLKGYPATFVQNSKREDMREIWKRITERNMTDPRVFSLDFNYHINQMKSGKYAAIMPAFVSRFDMAKDCDLALLGDKFLYEQMTFGLPTSSPLKPEFERVMQILVDLGLTDKWNRERSSWSDGSECISEKLVKSVTLEDVAGGIAAVAAGAGLALLTLAVEYLYHLYIRSQH